MRPWLIELETCPSTSTWALERIDALAHGACVWTRRQTAGRGRNGSTWVAPDGVLTASFVLHLRSSTPQIALAAGLAVCHAVEDRCPSLHVGLKWPNDCVLTGADGRSGKLAGILCERATGQTGRGSVVVGIGLNVDPKWDDSPAALLLATSTAYPPTSLAEHATGLPTTIDLLDGLRRYLLEAAGLLHADHWPRIIGSWRERDVLHGRQLVVSTGADQVSGQATGIDDQGRLTLTRDGGPVALTSGSITSW